MAEHFSFFDAVLQDDGVTYDREYNAQQFTKYFGALVTTGVMKGTGNMLAVSANGSNMVTKIDTGIAFVEAKYYENDSFKELTHDTETLGNSRIDRIVIRMDLSTEARYVRAFIKKGVPSTNPVAPALTQTPNLYEISLAQVKVIGGQTFIATNAVTDERGKDIICPWAGSNILPNFNADGLQELVDSQLVDGDRVKVWSNFGNPWKTQEYNLNNLTRQGFYFALDNYGSSENPQNFPSKQDNNKWLIQVTSLRPEGPLIGQNYIQQLAHAVGANGIPQYGGLYKRTSNHQGENWSPWVRVDLGITDSGFITCPVQAPFTVPFGADHCRVRRLGHIVTAEAWVQVSGSLNSNSIYTLPEGFKSYSNFTFSIQRQRGGTYVYLNGNCNGASMLLASEHMSQVTSGDYLVFNVAFAAEKSL